MTEIELLERIAQGIDILVLFSVLNFVSACMRSWRIKTLQLGE